MAGKGQDYSWGNEAQKQEPKTKPAQNAGKIQTKTAAPAPKLQTVDERVSRIFDSAEGDRATAVENFVGSGMALKRKTWTDYRNRIHTSPLQQYEIDNFNKARQDAKANILSVLKNMDPNETENIKNLFIEYFSSNGINEQSLKTFSGACSAAYGATKGSNISAYDIFYYSKNVYVYGAVGGGLKGITTPVPSSLDSMNIQELRPRQKAGQQQPATQMGADTTTITIDGTATSKDLAQIMKDLLEAKNRLVSQIGEDKASGTKKAFEDLETAYTNLKDYLERGNVRVQALSEAIFGFSSQLQTYFATAAMEYKAYKESHKRSWIEGAMDTWAVPLVVGVTAAFLRKPIMKKAMPVLEKGAGKGAYALYQGLGKREFGPFYQMLARTGVGTAAIGAGGLVGGTVEYTMDSMGYGAKKGDVKKFFNMQRSNINGMRGALDNLELQNKDNSQAIAAQIKSARTRLDNAEMEMGAAENAISRGQGGKAPNFMVDVLKSSAAIAAIGIALPFAARGAAKKWTTGQRLKAADEEIEKIATEARAALKGGSPAEQKAAKERLQQALGERDQFLPKNKKAATGKETLDELVGKLDKEAREKEINAAIAKLNEARQGGNPNEISAARKEAQKVMDNKDRTGTDELQGLLDATKPKRVRKK
jgi:hypothetical protein